MSLSGTEEPFDSARAHVHRAVIALDNVARFVLWETKPPTPERDAEANIKAAIESLTIAILDLETLVVRREAFLRKMNDWRAAGRPKVFDFGEHP